MALVNHRIHVKLQKCNICDRLRYAIDVGIHLSYLKLKEINNTITTKKTIFS